MSLQGPILIVASKPAAGLVQAFADAGAFPVVEVSWAAALTAASEVRPSAIVLSEPGTADTETALALTRHVAEAAPFTPLIIRVREGAAPAVSGALAVPDDAPIEHLIARVSSALRLRTLHSSVLSRAKTLKDERNIEAELPAGDPLDDVFGVALQHGPAGRAKQSNFAAVYLEFDVVEDVEIGQHYQFVAHFLRQRFVRPYLI